MVSSSRMDQSELKDTTPKKKSVLDRLVNISVLNNVTLKEIFNFYHHEEQWISICRDLSNTLTFSGGISIKWGKLFKNRTMDNESQAKLTEMLITALDYKRMFGFCPIKRVKDPKTGAVNVFIPQFGTGEFYHGLNSITLQTEVFFVPYVYTGGLSTSHYVETHTNYILRDIVDPDSFVYVWPGQYPTINNNQVKSDMLKLYKRWSTISELEENAMDADFNASHPTVFTQIQKENRSLDDMTEEELFADDDNDYVSPTDRRTYRIDRLRSRKLEEQQSDMKCTSENRNTISQVVKPKTGQVSQTRRRRVWEDNEYHLEEGEQLTRHTSPQSRNDYMTWRQHYEEQVCLLMRVPRTFFARSYVGLKTDAIQVQQALRTMVESNREEAQTFFQFIYNIQYKELDDAEIFEAFVSLDRAEKRELSSANGDETSSKSIRDRFARSRGKLTKIAKSENRIELIFEGDAFLRNMPVVDISIASQKGAITVHEEINMLRLRLGLDPLDPSDVLVKNAEKIREIDQSQKEKPRSLGQQKEKKSDRVLSEEMTEKDTTK